MRLIRLAQRALVLAPNDGLFHELLGNILLLAGQPVAAADSYRQATKLDLISFLVTYRWLGLTEILLGNDTEALAQLRLAEVLAGINNPRYIAQLTYAYSRLDRREDALKLFNQLKTLAYDGQYIPTDYWTLAYLAIGEDDNAYDELNDASNEGGFFLFQIIKPNIMNDPVLEEPRFVELRARIGVFE